MTVSVRTNSTFVDTSKGCIGTAVTALWPASDGGLTPYSTTWSRLCSAPANLGNG